LNTKQEVKKVNSFFICVYLRKSVSKNKEAELLRFADRDL